jgi:hypothetical protein
VKSTGMTGVKQFLKPDAYKQSEPGVRYQKPGETREARLSWFLVPGSWHRVTAYLLYNGSASWSY